MKSYRSTRKDCRDCPFRNECLGKKAQEKKFELSFYQEEYERAWQRQQTAYFKRQVKLRHGTIEPVFGNLINYYGLRKINTKGIAGAHIPIAIGSMLMSAVAFNLRKLMKFINKKEHANAQVMQKERCAFTKMTFYDCITSLLVHSKFLLSNSN